MSTSEQLNAMLEEMGIEITIYEGRMFEPKIVIDTFRHDKQVRAEVVEKLMDFVAETDISDRDFNGFLKDKAEQLKGAENEVD